MTLPKKREKRRKKNATMGENHAYMLTRSDVTLDPCLPSFPSVPYDRAGARRAQDALDRLDWLTTVNPEEDTRVREAGSIDSRPIARDEWDAPYFPYRPSRDGLDGTYILLQPNAALHPADGCPLPACRLVKNGAPLGEVLRHVYDMTVRSGEFAMADQVYFEGFSLMRQGPHRVLVVLTGS